MSKFLEFLTGKRTILVAVFGGVLAMMPEWAESLPPDAGVVAVLVSWVQSFWPQLAIIFAALKVNKVIEVTKAANGG